MRNILFIIITFWASFCGTSLYAYGRTKVVVSQSDDYVKVFSAQNTNYIIKEEINLGGKTVVVGAGSVLVFEGGSLSNGTIVGNNTKVKSRNYKIFKHGSCKYRAYVANTYKYVSKCQNAIKIMGTWQNTSCDCIVDFACLVTQVVVEINGGYHNGPEQNEFDRQRTNFLQSKGLSVFRFTNK